MSLFSIVSFFDLYVNGVVDHKSIFFKVVVLHYIITIFSVYFASKSIIFLMHWYLLVIDL